VALDPLGKSGEYFLGSIATVPGEAKPGDGVLQVLGGDTVTVEYVDQNTEDGKVNLKRIASVQMVSTAVIGFTDGAYREYMHGVFGDQECFLRVKDLDRDVSNAPDPIRVKVFSDYKVERQEEAAGVDLEGEKRQVRDSTEMVLTETGPHTGVFVGKLVPKVVASDGEIARGPGKLSVMKGDDVVMEYLDEKHILGPDPRTVQYRAKVLVGQIQDVKVEDRVVDSLELKARKNLIEAKIYLRLAQVFKEVGLITKANEKANEGMDRVEDVISTSLRASMDRKLVEEAFSVKWDLLLAQDKLSEAINVCNTLMQLFPDSTMADRALFKIALARMEGPNPYEAIGILAAVTGLPKSDLKAEAQFKIGQILEAQALRDAEAAGTEASLVGAMAAYKVCAEKYPDSSYAGESLAKIADYYIRTKDYARAIELMERVFQDYPDASFLDQMLGRWFIAAYRMGDMKMAKEKAQQLLSEYPNSRQAEAAKKVLDTLGSSEPQK
jgi:TolA-binding protein